LFEDQYDDVNGALLKLEEHFSQPKIKRLCEF